MVITYLTFQSYAKTLLNYADLQYSRTLFLHMFDLACIFMSVNVCLKFNIFSPVWSEYEYLFCLLFYFFGVLDYV